MKNIVALTDYSENAANALQYAASLAKAAHARLILYHVFPYPVVTDVPPDIMQQYVDVIADEHRQRLQEIKQTVEKQYNIQVAYIAEAGTPAHGLPQAMKRENGDVAVVGLRGANPILGIIMGSTPAEILRRGETPLLIVPGTATFKHPQHILFACDNPMIENPVTIRPLKDIATLFSAEIEVYMVDETPLRPGQTRRPRPSNLEEHFTKLKHVYTFEMAEGVREHILEAIEKSSADMLAMIPHHRSVWAYLLDKSDTLSVALQTTVPMLVLAENTKA